LLATESATSVTRTVSASVQPSSTDTADITGTGDTNGKVVGPVAKRARRATASATSTGQRDSRSDSVKHGAVLSVEAAEAHSGKQSMEEEVEVPQSGEISNKH